MSDMPYTYFWESVFNPMSERFNALIQKRLTLKAQEGNARREPFANAAALFFYVPGDGYDKITQRVKYHGDLGAGKFFASMLGDRLFESPQFGDVDVVVPVPLHWRRKLERGYNQAEVIGKSVSKKLGAVVDGRLLTRRKYTKAQTHLPTEQKFDNMAFAFCVDRQRLACLVERRVRHFLIVDDVFTTGATLSSCYYSLRDALACLGDEGVKISVATIGFARG